MEAAIGDHVKTGKILINSGANVNAKTNTDIQNTPLTLAAARGHLRFVKLLLRKYAQFLTF